MHSLYACIMQKENSEDKPWNTDKNQLNLWSDMNHLRRCFPSQCHYFLDPFECDRYFACRYSSKDIWGMYGYGEKDVLLIFKAARTESFTAPALLAAFSVFQTPLCLFVQRVASLSFCQPSTLLRIQLKFSICINKLTVK